jgi:hypothetical protein
MTRFPRNWLAFFGSVFICSAVAAALLIAPASLHAAETASIGNKSVTRDISWAGGVLTTSALVNRLGNTRAENSGGDELAVTVRLEGAGADRRLTAADFTVNESQVGPGNSSLEVRLSGKSVPIDLVVRYVAKPGDPWMRKQLLVTARRSLQIKNVEVEHLAFADAFTPYNANQLTTRGNAKWRPPLGQPIYTRTSGLWWGMEFPAARNEVKKGRVVCGYLTAVDLAAGAKWSSHSAVVGAADHPDFVKDAFLDYIDATRARPLRLQTQYNSWFDYHKAVDSDKFVASVRKVNEELVTDRKVPPLRAYVIDDGWQDTAQDWSKVGVWPENAKFASNFQQAREAVADAKSSLGLWLSPGSVFGGQPAIPAMRAAGWRTLDPWMSMTGKDYMDSLEKRMVQLATSRVDYFKLDGVFGHLNTRNFDIEGFKGGEEKLNDAKFDVAKERYLSRGTERLMRIFKRMGEVNPDVYIVISNGAFLSPWWLQHVDAVWMINAGDAAKGTDRTAELVYRDSAYFQLAASTKDDTQFPLNSIFNHEPKKTTTGEAPDVFRRYLLMSLSRGTGFVELYLETVKLSESDWDVLAEGLKWAHHVFPAFKRSRMIGGNPKHGEVYGYTGWTKDFGYVSLHNPSNESREFSIVLDRALGLPSVAAREGSSYVISTPLTDDVDSLPKTATAGRTCTIKLPPRAIRLLEFSAQK